MNKVVWEQRKPVPTSGAFGFPGLGPVPRYWPGNLPHAPFSLLVETTGEGTAPAGTIRSPKLSALEALLLSSAEPLSPEGMAVQLGGESFKIKELLRELQQSLNKEQSALTLSESVGGWKMVTQPELHGWLVRAGLVSEAPLLAEPLAEALAVVAYRQPITRADVDEMRGAPSTDLMRQLLDKRLIRLAGRQKTLGRPPIYRTTRQFLDTFGLADLDELPPVDGMIAGTEPEATPP